MPMLIILFTIKITHSSSHSQLLLPLVFSVRVTSHIGKALSGIQSQQKRV